MPYDASPSRPRRRCPLWILLAIGTAVACAPTPAPEPEPAAQPLTLGLLMDYSGALGTLGEPGERGVRLAVQQVNAAGGVLGRPVEIATADGATDPDTSVEAARELIDGGADALIGPFGSAATLAVARGVAVPGGIPLLSPTATAPEVTAPEHDGFVFRGAASDLVQGPALARLTVNEGFERVAVLYRLDSYGRGLAEAFAAAFPGEITARVAIEPSADSYLEELRQAAAGEPQALVAIAFAADGEVFLPEAMENGIFDRFVFADAMLQQFLIDSVGAERLEGIRGTAPGAEPPADPESVPRFNDSVTEAFGEGVAASPAAYDLALCVCLAAERAGSTAGEAIRDALPAVCGEGGEPFFGGSTETVAAVLAAVREGADVDYDGVAGALDWNASGDITSGRVFVWEIRDGAFQQVADLDVQLGDEAAAEAE